MAGEKPTAAFVLGLIGGIIVILEAIFLFVVDVILGSMISQLPVGMPIDLGGLFAILAAIVLLFGLIMFIASVVMYARPQMLVAGGVILLVFSIIGRIFAAGFYLGAVLGLVGGILGIIFKPTPAMAPMAPPMAPPPMSPPP